MKFIDLTHTFTDKMPVYPGDPESSLKRVTTIEKEGYNDHDLHTVLHVGTHMDAPFHMIENGIKIDEIFSEKTYGVPAGVLARIL